MDAGTIRGIGTLILFVSFVVLCAWAWAPAQRRRFDEASRLPFLGDDEVMGEIEARRQSR
jgi:cytochrome c oxidase cbb3-type subunit 4